MCRKIGCFFLLVLTIELMGQDSALLFNHITTDNGLQNNLVITIYQDKEGFMWFGSGGGLSRYDGYDIINYMNDPDATIVGIPTRVTRIFEDSNNRFWVGTSYTGLYLFDRVKETFKNYRYDKENPNSLGNNNIRSIFEDSRHNLWIGTSGGGINLYNPQTDSFSKIIHNASTQNTIPSNIISSISEDKSGNLWIASPEGFLTKFDPRDSTFFSIKIYDNTPQNVHYIAYGNLFIDSDENIWLTSEFGLFRYNEKTTEVKHYIAGNSNYNLSGNYVTDVLEFKAGVLMISIDNGGLNELDVKTGIIRKYYSDKYNDASLTNNKLYKLYRSSEGILWVASYKGGVDYYDENQRKLLNQKYLLPGLEKLNCCYSVSDMIWDNDGNLWIGYDDNGIDVYKPGKGVIKHYAAGESHDDLKSDVILYLAKHSNGDIYVGTYLGGINKYDWKKKNFTQLWHAGDEENPFKNTLVLGAVEVDENYIWIGSPTLGLGQFDLDGKFIKTFPEIQNVFNCFTDNENIIWVNAQSGLFKFDQKTDSFIKMGDESSSDSANIFNTRFNDVFFDSKGNQWVGSKWGLHKFNMQNRLYEKVIVESSASEINEILSIAEDNEGNLWLASVKGLIKYDVKNNESGFFSTGDALKGDNIIPGVILKNQNNDIYLGSTNGFLVFNTDRIKLNLNRPKVVFTELKVMNSPVTVKTNSEVLSRSISYADKIRLNYNQTVFTVKFAALNYTNAHLNQYKYMLDGFDQDWIESGNRREVTYTNLNPGIYTLRVKAGNDDDIWNDKEATIKIEVIPPYWKTIWFYIITSISLIIILLLIYFWRLKKLESDKKMLTSKVKQRTKELEEHKQNLEKTVETRTKELLAAKEKAEESDRLKSAFLANMSHEIRTPMNAIVGFSNLLADGQISEEEKTEYIQLISSNSDTLIRLIEDILDFSLIEANQLNLKNSIFYLNEVIDNVYSSISLNFQNNNYSIIKTNKLEAEKLKIITDKSRLTQILFNLMNNACKFTKKGEVELIIEREMRNIIFKVRDTGVGIHEEEKETIFLRFRRLQEVNDEYRGVGLGLAISKRLSELLGGELSFDSQYGEGTTFILRFPSDRIISDDEAISSVKLSTNLPDLNDKSIMIAEDEEANFLFLKKALTKANAKVLWAQNGKEALDILNSNERKVDLVLMDIRMPVMDGFKAFEEIKKNNLKVKVIAQTAYARVDDEVKIREAGFDGYISKPININALYTSISNFL